MSWGRVRNVAKELCRLDGRDPETLSHREQRPLWNYYVESARKAIEAVEKHTTILERIWSMY